MNKDINKYMDKFTYHFLHGNDIHKYGRIYPITNYKFIFFKPKPPFSD